MFENLGLHTIHYPSGRWGFVGTVPTTLCEERIATTADVLGCRTHRNPGDDAIYTWRIPSFATLAEALAYAEARGEKVCDSPSCCCRTPRK